MRDLHTLFPEFDDHEMVLYATDESTGLRSFIAIHNSKLGPATGGTRLSAYESEEEALRDVLRLSKSMTYKCALAGVPYGGGKAVIIADPKKASNELMLRAYAQKINLLGGKFTTGEDVGITEEDLKVMQKESPFISGKPNLAGDLSPWAALGVLMGIRAALKHVFGTDNLAGRTFAIKGLGKVGSHLVELIYQENGEIIGADIDPVAIRAIKRRFPRIKIVDPSEIHKLKVDVFSPCALGSDLNSKTIPQLKCKIVCGGANNQLEDNSLGNNLHKAGIIYVPDYVANAGGLINVVAEMDVYGYNRAWVERKVKDITKTVKKILEMSAKKNTSTVSVSDKLAESILKKKSKTRNAKRKTF